MAPHRLDSVDAAVRWLGARGVRGLVSDSRRVGRGDAFVAWPGATVDARRFVAPALAAGAAACLVEADGVDAFAWDDTARIAALPGLKAATGAIASRLLGTPSERLAVVAVTGTNGKTSTAWWVAQAFGVLGRRCGLVGTLGIGEPPRPGDPAAAGATLPIEPTGMTTPDAVALQTGLKRLADAGCDACAVEATSIGIAEGRLAGTAIDTAVFTNLTQDHLDYHGTMAGYAQAKARLFAWPGLRAAVVNIDDMHGAAIAASLRDAPVQVWTYAVTREARLRASDLRCDAAGLRFRVHEGAAQAEVETALIGAYNVANLLAAIGVLRAAGIALGDAARACSALTPVPGRMERVQAAARPGDPAVLPEAVVDFAHTPDALEQALRALQPLAAARGGQLWCVFGCGGNRDAGKRPLMGAIAQRLAQQVVVTSDNPRDEAPAAIVAQVVAGVGADRSRVAVIEDRRAAIAHALRAADARDVVLIAGKGHEATQEVGGAKLPFSDIDEAAAALDARAAGAA